MSSSRSLALARDFLGLLGKSGVSSRDDWLAALLRLTAEVTRAHVLYVAETRGRRVRRSAWIDGRLQRREDERLRGLGRSLAGRTSSYLEHDLGAGTPFRSSADGWEGVRVRGYAAAPVAYRPPEAAWLVALAAEGTPPLHPETLDLMEVSAEAMASAFANEVRFSELESLAMTDGLTKIPNYRYLRHALDREILQSSRHRQIFTVAMVDVDHLKAYNLVHGHLVGSELLVDLAQLLRRETRASDIVARYGGDEFVLILPHTGREGGRVLSERVREFIRGGLRGRGGEVITCSFGLASFPEDGRDWVSLLTAADRGLSMAKEEGRDLVVSARV